MAGQTTGRTAGRPTSKSDDKTVVTATGSDQSDAPATSAPTTSAPAAPPQRPEPSPRTGVLVNVDAVRAAFTTGSASQAVGYVQHVLRARGLEPDEPTGVADHRTRTALAKFQESIGEVPTGLPTDETLDYLGFDVV